MIVNKIEYSLNFLKSTKKISGNIIKQVKQKETIFKQNPRHPSLRLHELHGKLKGVWSISINKNYRIIFEYHKNGDVVFISIGNHDIYK